MKAFLFFLTIFVLIPQISSAQPDSESDFFSKNCGRRGSNKIFEKENVFEKCINLYKSGRYFPVTELGRLYAQRPSAYLKEPNITDENEIKDYYQKINQIFLDSQIEQYAWLSAGVKSKGFLSPSRQKDKQEILSEIKVLKEGFTLLKQTKELDVAEKKSQKYYELYVQPYDYKWEAK